MKTSRDTEQINSLNRPNGQKKQRARDSSVNKSDEGDDKWQNTISKRSLSQMTSQVHAQRDSYETDRNQEISKS